MHISTLTANHLGAFFCRACSLALSAAFAYSFTENAGLIAIVLALTFILVTEIARIESYKKIVLKHATLVDSAIFAVTLLISIITVTGTINSLSLNTEAQGSLDSYKRSVLESEIKQLNIDINELNREIAFYTKRSEIRMQVNPRKETRAVKQARLESKQAELIKLVEKSTVDTEASSAATDAVVSLFSLLKINVDPVKINTVGVIAAGLFFDLLALVFVGWITREKSLINNHKYEAELQSESKRDGSNLTQKTVSNITQPYPINYSFADLTLNFTQPQHNSIKVGNKQGEVFSGESEIQGKVFLGESEKEIKAKSKKKQESSEIEQLVAQASELINNRTVVSGFRTNLRRALKVKESTAKAIVDILSERGVLLSYETENGQTRHRLPETQLSLVVCN
ncbi:hypothetical protein KCM76_22315 [Zooshikella marina]|uniref:hypothetical protein n=1 Tax=Zooshikella ganghwensis TaxID=202772 RepID=UPI001BAF99B8|nr:hypothetical protein [Zooshikella ganghwensis]MBU2708744.1 hypothetical protein [Zooshikella ganghwensis]